MEKYDATCGRFPGWGWEDVVAGVRMTASNWKLSNIKDVYKQDRLKAIFRTRGRKAAFLFLLEHMTKIS